jgi:hypothetical protein
LPELALIEGNQEVATKLDESLSPSLFTFRSHFAAIHHHWYYVFMTVGQLPRSPVGGNTAMPSSVRAAISSPAVYT